VTETLARFEAAGVTVLRQFAVYADFERKGDLLGLAIRGWDARGEYDLALPVDCDEFLALFTAAGLTCARGAIHAYLDTLAGRPEVLAIQTSSYNVPGRPGWFWPAGASKRFFTAGTIGTLDQGFHVATSRKSDAVFLTRLTHLHLHHKPHATVLEHAHRKLQFRVDVNDLAALRAYNGPGDHLVRHFMRTEAEYLTQFDDVLTFGYTGFSAILSALGHRSEMVTVPQPPAPPLHGTVSVRRPSRSDPAGEIVLFDAEAYLRAHLDVAAIGAPPLEHYLYHGFNEGRAVSDVRDAGREEPLAWPPLPAHPRLRTA
jgi:hypothetical protein